MVDDALKSAVMEELLERPWIDRLGLKEEHFYGAVVKANEKLARGEADEAMDDFGKMVLISPESAVFQIGLAESAIAAGYFELGLQSASVAVMLEPDAPEGFFHSGRACFLMGEPALAAEDFRDAIARCEKDPRYSDMARTARALLIKAETQG